MEQLALFVLPRARGVQEESDFHDPEASEVQEVQEASEVLEVLDLEDPVVEANTPNMDVTTALLRSSNNRSNLPKANIPSLLVTPLLKH